jgi:hypothetical protein
MFSGRGVNRPDLESKMQAGGAPQHVTERHVRVGRRAGGQVGS